MRRTELQGMKAPGQYAYILLTLCRKDVMIAMGIVQGPKDCLGFEASGVITRMGSAVNHVKVGDRVLTTYAGLFSTRKVIPSQFVFPIPAVFTFKEAVTMPIVYLTVIYAIITLGQLEKGQVRCQEEDADVKRKGKLTKTLPSRF